MDTFDISSLQDLSTAEMASGMYKRIKSQIDDLLSEINSDEHILVTIDSLAITDVGYHNPHMLIFYCKDSQENQVRKLIHINSLNMNLIVLKNHNSEKPKKSIGFLGEID
ncbi:ribosomal protein S3AE [Peptoniphilus olsenii]|uniref:Ribosomal protein S3AE n=1 Tax=Peptoniphilus olsenii TaxID=411570 RepID=A0ABV2J777_9FIRM